MLVHNLILEEVKLCLKLVEPLDLGHKGAPGWAHLWVELDSKQIVRLSTLQQQGDPKEKNQMGVMYITELDDTECAKFVHSVVRRLLRHEELNESHLLRAKELSHPLTVVRCSNQAVCCVVLDYCLLRSLLWAVVCHT